MGQNLFERAILLWNNGEFLAVNADDRNSLYRYDDKLYIIWYTQQNVVEKISEIDELKAHQLFSQFVC
jgi:hypothetical protein